MPGSRDGGPPECGTAYAIEYDGLVTATGAMLPKGTLLDAKDWNAGGWMDPEATGFPAFRTRKLLRDEAIKQIARQRAGMAGTPATGLVWVFSDAEVAKSYESLLDDGAGKPLVNIVTIPR